MQARNYHGHQAYARGAVRPEDASVIRYRTGWGKTKTEATKKEEEDNVAKKIF